MKQMQALLALALLLLTGLNCGTENPVKETVDTSAVETPTGTLRGEVLPIDGVLIQVRLLRDGQLLAQTRGAERLMNCHQLKLETTRSKYRQKGMKPKK